ncbi:MAG: PIG-L family deacetylase [Streptosporangiales bacterium]|nr:PIG-L family deacetylase [Streptosporangiales bacterium]
MRPGSGRAPCGQAVRPPRPLQAPCPPKPTPRAAPGGPEAGRWGRLWEARRVRRTCVFFHAHPDDEALLTAGTMARLADEGHRVVLVVATDGDLGLAAPTGGRPLGEVRLAELRRSAAALGVARIIHLDYADSGLNPEGPPASTRPAPDVGGPAGGAGRRVAFSAMDVEEAAARLAAILAEESADLVTSYDPAGGYGHPDHVQVHRVGARAAQLAGTPLVLEATVDRDRLLRLARLAARFHHGLATHLAEVEHTYTPSAEITHRIRVARYAHAKRAAMRAHATQATGGDSIRLLAVLSRLPLWLFRLLLGTEWYVRRDIPTRPAARKPGPDRG